MTEGFSASVVGRGSGLSVRWGKRAVAEMVFELPGDPVPGWEPDDEGARLTRSGSVTARLRHVRHERGWTTTVSIDNAGEDEAELPTVGFSLIAAPGWAGWSWTDDLDGFVVVAPVGHDAPTLVGWLRQGFLSAAQERPVYGVGPLADGQVESRGAAFHLAPEGGTLRPFGRHASTLEFGAVKGPDAVASRLPDWLPDLIVRDGDDLRFETPDLAVVAGPDAQVVLDDTAAFVIGAPGHREVSVHGVRGVHRLRATFAPAPQPFLADHVAAWKSRRPRTTSTATAAVVAAALARRGVWDAEATLDWLEHEDWLTREAPLGMAVAAIVAAETRDAALLQAACAAVLDAEPTPGLGIVGTRCWVGCLRAGLPRLDLTVLFDRYARDGGDPLLGLEYAVVRGAEEGKWGRVVTGLVNRLGSGLPGQPMGLSEADAGLAAAVLRLVPETWSTKPAAAAASEKTEALLLADYADGLHPEHEGLAWLLLGDVGS